MWTHSLCNGGNHREMLHYFIIYISYNIKKHTQLHTLIMQSHKQPVDRSINPSTATSTAHMQ